MSQQTSDPAAEFAVALSIYTGLNKRRALSLSEAFNGYDQFMRSCMQVGRVFEAWACKHVDFDALADVWPYLLEEKFLEAYEEALGRLTQDTLYNLSLFDDNASEKVWAKLREKQL